MATELETVNITVTGANPRTQSIQVGVDISSGNGSGSFTYSGTNPGADSVVAVCNHLSLTSNTANTAWTVSHQATPTTLPASSSWSLINGNTGYKSHVGSGGTFGVALTPVIPQGFGLAVPSGNLPTGVQIIFWEMSNYNNPQTGAIHTVQLYNNGAPVGTAKTVNYTMDEEPSGNFSSSYGRMVTWGGPTDLWGLSPSALAAIVSSTSFGYGITCYAPNVGSGYGEFLMFFYIRLYYAAVTSNPAPTGTFRVTPPNNGPLIDSSIVTVATTNPQAGTSWGINMPPSVVAQSASYTVSFNGFHFSNIPYIPVFEGSAGFLFLYDNGSVFDFGGAKYPPVTGVVPDYASAISVGAVGISGDNSAWQGLFSLTPNGPPSPGGNLLLSYNGDPVVPHTDVTSLTITADDIAWFDATGTKYDLFTTSGGGGGLQYQIQTAYMVRPDQSAVTVSPTSIPADGGNHTLTVNLPKPMSPEQQGLFGTGNTITASASASNGVTITTQPAAVLDGGGWLTGWNVVVHVPASSTNSSFQLSMSVTGTLTYLAGSVFVVNGPVTYLTGPVGGTITTTGSGYNAPSNYSFAVTGAISGTAPNYSINGTITMTAVIFATDNGAMNPVTFYRVLNGVRTNIANGTVGSPVPVSGGYHTTATLSVATQFGWGTPLKLGYQATDALTTLGFTYLDTNTYNNTTPSGGGGGGGGGGGCPAVEMWVSESLQVSDVVVGMALDTLAGETADYLNAPITTEWQSVQWLDYSEELCYRLVTENGAEVVVSESTPVPTMEAIEALADGLKPVIFASEVRAGLHAITDVGNGPEWSQLILTECVGMRRVARLYCGGRNFAAGARPGKYIYTHNLVIVK